MLLYNAYNGLSITKLLHFFHFLWMSPVLILIVFMFICAPLPFHNFFSPYFKLFQSNASICNSYRCTHYGSNLVPMVLNTSRRTSCHKSFYCIFFSNPTKQTSRYKCVCQWWDSWLERSMLKLNWFIWADKLFFMK